jgi:hypothetical protein
MNTRVEEGFQQEVAALYKKTNGKNAEHQVFFFTLWYTVILLNEYARSRL